MISASVIFLAASELLLVGIRLAEIVPASRQDARTTSYRATGGTHAPQHPRTIGSNAPSVSNE
jgi:hypothetical protein